MTSSIEDAFRAGWQKCTAAVFSPDTSVTQTCDVAWQEYAPGELRTIGKARIVTETDGSRWLSIDDDMSTTDLWNALETVLRDKGASDAWLRYAMPDLHTMAMQFGLGEFHRGYVAHERGEGCGAYDPPRVGNEQSLQELADADQAEFEDLREAFVAGYRSGNQYDRGADFSDTEFADWIAKREAEPSTPLHILVPPPYTPPWTNPVAVKADGGNND